MNDTVRRHEHPGVARRTDVGLRPRIIASISACCAAHSACASGESTGSGPERIEGGVERHRSDGADQAIREPEHERLVDVQRDAVSRAPRAVDSETPVVVREHPCAGASRTCRRSRARCGAGSRRPRGARCTRRSSPCCPGHAKRRRGRTSRDLLRVVTEGAEEGVRRAARSDASCVVHVDVFNVGDVPRRVGIERSSVRRCVIVGVRTREVGRVRRSTRTDRRS